jgi:hypothetical protein
MSSPQSKKLRKKLLELDYTESVVHGLSLWRRDGFGDVALFDALTKQEVDALLGTLNRAHQKPPKPDTDVVSKAEQAEFDARERDRKQRERATYLATKDRRLGGAAKGLPEWMVDQLDAAAESVIRRDLELRRLMTQRPYADVAD